MGQTALLRRYDHGPTGEWLSCRGVYAVTVYVLLHASMQRCAGSARAVLERHGREAPSSEVAARTCSRGTVRGGARSMRGRTLGSGPDAGGEGRGVSD
jgi:hypothetical protein